jgi:hypothetical protein
MSKIVGTGSVAASKTAEAVVETRQLENEIPPLKDLLHIAAMLAIGRPLDDQNLRTIAGQAMKLWEACLEERNQTKTFVSFRAKSLEQELAKQAEIPKPENFPVTFDDLLKLWIGGRNKDYRIKIYRNYAKELIWRGHVSEVKYPRSHQERFASAVMSDEEAGKLARPVSSAEIDDVMRQAAEKTIQYEELYRMSARDFLNWFKEYKANVRQERAKAGAEGKKKKQKNAEVSKA